MYVICRSIQLLPLNVCIDDTALVYHILLSKAVVKICTYTTSALFYTIIFDPNLHTKEKIKVSVCFERSTFLIFYNIIGSKNTFFFTNFCYLYFEKLKFMYFT